MKSLLVLEETYGSLEDAIKAFYSKDKNENYRAFIDFAFVSLGKLPKKRIEDLLTETNIGHVFKALVEVVTAYLPGKGADEDAEKPKDNTFDWDALLYHATQHFRMTEGAFWDCSPKRFYKLLKLWNEEHGVKSEDEKVFEVDDMPW